MITDTREGAHAGELAEAERRQRILSEISRVFLEYTGADEVEPLRRVVDLVVQGMGDWCAFSLVDPEGLMRQVVAHHPDPRQRELGERIHQVMPVQRWDAGPPESNVFLLGRPFYLEHITDAILRAGTPNEEAYQLYKELGLSSVIVAPMRSGEQPIGALVLASSGKGGRSYSAHDVEFVKAIADRATLAVRNARLVKALAAERDAAHRQAVELTAVFAADPAGLALFDADNRLKYVSRRIDQLFHFPFSELIGQHFHDVYDRVYAQADPHEREAAILRMNELFADRNAVITDDLTFESREGRKVLRRATVPVRAEDDTYLGRFFVFTDVTQERELDRQRAEFLTVASHELRTPLTPLSMHLQTIERKLQRGVAIESSTIARARRQLARLTTLVDDLLDVSRFETGRLELAFERFDVVELVTEVVGEFRTGHGDHGVIVEQPNVPAMIEGDRKRLEQVLVNLLQNAAKYSPNGERIVVRVEPTAKEVRISVTDQGIGVPVEEQTHLFERFFRAQNARVTNYGGLGMGLFISHEIVQRHGGRFEVQSAAGQGSTFTFILPLAAPVALHSVTPRPRILMVDDDPAILEATTSFLEEEGYAVDQARNGVAALELLRRSPPDLILVDLMMPVLDGGAFIETMRREHLAPDALIVILSADRAVSAKSQHLKADGALSKPFDLDELDQLVSRLLKRAG